MRESSTDKTIQERNRNAGLPITGLLDLLAGTMEGEGHIIVPTISAPKT